MLYLVLEIDPFTDYSALSVAMRFLRGFASWFWVVAIMGLLNRGRRSGAQKERRATEIKHGSQPHSLDRSREPSLKERIAGYVKEAQLPFYILHQTPIVLIGYYVVQWNVNALYKYIVISLSALVVTLVVYDIGVRRTRLTRFLFGMRSRRESTEVPPPHLGETSA